MILIESLSLVSRVNWYTYSCIFGGIYQASSHSRTQFRSSFKMQEEFKNYYCSHGKTPQNSCCGKHSYRHSNCHLSGSTTISRIKSYFSWIFSASDWVWQGCQCWPILMGYWTPLLGISGLGTPYLSGWDFLRAVLQAETLPPQPSFLPLSFQTALQSEGFFCLFLLLPFYSLAVFLQQVSWKTHLILVCASQMTWTNTMTLKITIRNCFEGGEHEISISTEKRSGRN